MSTELDRARYETRRERPTECWSCAQRVTGRGCTEWSTECVCARSETGRERPTEVSTECICAQSEPGRERPTECWSRAQRVTGRGCTEWSTEWHCAQCGLHKRVTGRGCTVWSNVWSNEWDCAKCEPGRKRTTKCWSRPKLVARRGCTG